MSSFLPRLVKKTKISDAHTEMFPRLPIPNVQLLIIYPPTPHFHRDREHSKNIPINLQDNGVSFEVEEASGCGWRVDRVRKVYFCRGVGSRDVLEGGVGRSWYREDGLPEVEDGAV
jgi:hypothetical protein